MSYHLLWWYFLYLRNKVLLYSNHDSTEYSNTSSPKQMLQNNGPFSVLNRCKSLLKYSFIFIIRNTGLGMAKTDSILFQSTPQSLLSLARVISSFDGSRPVSIKQPMALHNWYRPDLKLEVTEKWFIKYGRWCERRYGKIVTKSGSSRFGTRWRRSFALEKMNHRSQVIDGF